jgi:methylthioribose-1-phosphate isomerase
MRCSSSTSASCRMRLPSSGWTAWTAVFTAIRDMWVRGAPLIGATAAYGLALQAARRCRPTRRCRRGPHAGLGAADGGEPGLGAATHDGAAAALALPTRARRPGGWPMPLPTRTWPSTRPSAATACRCSRPSPPARPAERADALQCRLAGHRGLGHRAGAHLPGAGRGHPVHVWVDETRPRNQGASLTAWELGQQGVAHT